MRPGLSDARAAWGLWWAAALLGLATIGAYGTAYYAIGVLLPVIAEDTGWSTGALSAGFSLGVLGQGAVALLAGRTFDARGSRPVLLPALVVGGGLLFAASYAQASWQFVVLWALGGAAVGGGLYYNVTMPAVTRLYPQRRAGAFAVLTLLGALASPIFYPIAGWLIDAYGWRVALQALVVLSAACVAPAAIFVRAPAAPVLPSPAEGGPSLASDLRSAAVRRALLSFGLGAAANAALILHQVAALQAAGLTIALASTIAGSRGAMQIPGRLVISPLTARLGVAGSVAASHAVAATGTLALLVAVAVGAEVPMALYFAVAAGVSLGLLSPLHGMLQAEVYGEARLGTLSGVTVVVTSVAAALGAWLAGVAVDLTGSYATTLTAVLLLQGAALAALRWQRRAPRAGAARREAEEAAGPEVRGTIGS